MNHTGHTGFLADCSFFQVEHCWQLRSPNYLRCPDQDFWGRSLEAIPSNTDHRHRNCVIIYTIKLLNHVHHYIILKKSYFMQSPVYINSLSPSLGLSLLQTQGLTRSEQPLLYVHILNQNMIMSTMLSSWRLFRPYQPLHFFKSNKQWHSVRLFCTLCVFDPFNISTKFEER